MMHRLAAVKQRHTREKRKVGNCTHCAGTGDVLPAMVAPKSEIMARFPISQSSSVSAPPAPTADLPAPTADLPAPTADLPAPTANLPAITSLSLTEPVPVDVSVLQKQLQNASEEIRQLKDVILRATRDGLTIAIPVPSINSTGILDTSQYETVKALYSGIVLEMIETAHKQLDLHNKKSYAFYQVEKTEGKEEHQIKMTFSVIE
jgi:hypothetical protein